MADIALIQDPTDGSFDIALDGTDLQLDSGLRTAVIMSVYCDRRADPDDALPQDPSPIPGTILTRDPRGFWGDWYPVGATPATAPRTGAPPADRLGSKLWLRVREKQLPSVLATVKSDIEAALAWLVEDKIAQSVVVTTFIVRQGVLGWQAVITKPNGSQETHAFDDVWAGTAAS